MNLKGFSNLNNSLILWMVEFLSFELKKMRVELSWPCLLQRLLFGAGTEVTKLFPLLTGAYEPDPTAR